MGGAVTVQRQPWITRTVLSAAVLMVVVREGTSDSRGTDSGLDDGGPLDVGAKEVPWVNETQESALSEGVSPDGPLSDIWDYHKPLFPLDQSDYLAIVCASLALTLAASGGIGGGGILVPTFIIILGFRPKHAIALANITILGGAIANTMLNARKRHPQLNQPLIDWDLIVIMEPLTIYGAVFGSLLSKVLPNIILTVLLVVILAYMGRRTFKKGLDMWKEESRKLHSEGEILNSFPSMDHDLKACGGTERRVKSLSAQDTFGDASYLELQADSETAPVVSKDTPSQSNISCKISGLTVCFAGTVALTILRGGGRFPSPLGVTCGSKGFWILYLSVLPWVLGFALIFRRILVREFRDKVVRGYTFITGEVQWNPRNTVVYPVVCALAGLFAGLFGVGGGIVKGPLMLEMGVNPSVASASSAAMILFTSAAASVSFMVFGLLHQTYAEMFFILGFACTAVSQIMVTTWVQGYGRQSPVVLSIGAVILLSSALVAVNTALAAISENRMELLKRHTVCSDEA